MRMIKQRPMADGTVAMDCGVCVVAMLTDLPYEKALVDMPNYNATSDFDWMLLKSSRIRGPPGG